MAINKWKLENNNDKKLEVVKLKKYNEFDSIKHFNKLIEFEGGGIDNKLFNFQFIHNSNVICSNLNKKIHYIHQNHI